MAPACSTYLRGHSPCQAKCARIRAGADQGLASAQPVLHRTVCMMKDVRVTPSDTTTLLPLHRLEF